MDLRPDKDKGVIDKIREKEMLERATGWSDPKKLMRFISVLTDQVKDEIMAVEIYNDLAAEADKLGLPDEKDILTTIADQEAGHKRMLEEILVKVTKM